MFHVGVYVIDFIAVTKQPTLKIMIQSGTYINSMEIQQQLLQQSSSTVTLQSLDIS